jgi:hypothetical protein
MTINSNSSWLSARTKFPANRSVRELLNICCKKAGRFFRILAPPDKAVRECNASIAARRAAARDTFSNLQISNFAAENPIPLVPHAAMPEQFFDVSQRPQRREKNYPVAEIFDKTPGRFAPRFRVKINEREIRNAVNNHVRHRKSVIGIKRDDADIPANGGRRDDNILADVQKPFVK